MLIHLNCITASLLLIGSMFGAVVGGLQCQLLGRKTSLLVDCVELTAAYIGIGASTNYIVLMISRFVCGHCCATLLVNIPAYTSEICQPEVRKITGSFVVVAFTSGFCIMLVLGAVIPWRVTMYINAAFPAISILLVFWLVPDSPVWLLMKHRENDAKKALMVLRGNEQIADLELKAIRDNLEHQINLEKEILNEDQNRTRWYSGLLEIYDSFRDSTFLKPFGVLLVIFCIGLEWAGFPAIAFYMVNLLEEANIPMDPYWGAAAIAGYRTVLLMISPTITKNFKRRPMYLINCMLVVLGNCGVATYFLLRAKTNIISDFPVTKWVPIFSIVIIYTAFAFGFGSVPYILQGEILPAHSRSIGTGLLGLFDNIFCFMATKMAPTIADNFGRFGAFYLYAGCTLFSGLVAYFQMPETLGLSLEQIESMYRKPPKSATKKQSIISRSNSVLSFYETVSQYGR